MQFYRKMLFCVFAALFLMIGCGDNPTTETAEESPAAETTSGTVAQITGRVLPPGVSPQIIVIRNGVDFKQTVADSEGRYELSGLPAGDYSLQIVATGFFTDISIKSVQLKRGERREVELVILREQSAAATLFGQILNKSNRQPLEGAEVQVECSTGVCAPLSGISDPDGNFSIIVWSGLGSNVNVRKPGYRNVPIQVKALKPHQKFDMGQIRLERVLQ